METPDVTPFKTQGQDLVTRAQALTIQTNDDYQAAGQLLNTVAALKKDIVTFFAEPKRKAHEAHRAITALERSQLDAPEKAEKTLKDSMSAFLREEEVRRREAEAKAQAELKRQEEDRVIAEAERLESAGHVEEAAQVLDAPIVVPVVEMEKPRAAGISSAKRWAFRIVDPAKIDRAFLVVDEAKIRALVKALGPDAAAKVGGIEVYPDVTIRANAGKAAA